MGNAGDGRAGDRTCLKAMELHPGRTCFPIELPEQKRKPTRARRSGKERSSRVGKKAATPTAVGTMKLAVPEPAFRDALWKAEVADVK